MTRDEVIGILGVMRTIYPHSFKDLPRLEIEELIAVWAELFSDDDPQLVSLAVKTYMASNQSDYMPKPAHIKHQMYNLQNKNERTPLEAWLQVKRAVSNGTYGSVKEFEKLDPLLQQLVHHPQQLREWAMMDAETLDSVIGSNFQRSYQARAKASKEYEMIPGNVKLMLDSVAKTLSMPLSKPKQIEEPKKEPADNTQALEHLQKIKKQMDALTDMPKYIPVNDEEFEEKRKHALAQLAAIEEQMKSEERQNDRH